MLLEHNGNRLPLGSPSAEHPAEPWESSRPPRPPRAVPAAGSERLRTLAGSAVLCINSAAARSAAEAAARRGCAGVKGAL